MPKTFYQEIREEVLENFDSLIKHQSVINKLDNKKDKKDKFKEAKRNYEELLLLIEDKLDKIKHKNLGSKTIRNNTARHADVREYELTENLLNGTESKVKELIEEINKKMEILNGGSHHRKTKRNSKTKRHTKTKRHSKTKRH